MSTLRADLSYAVRQLLRHPVFALSAMLSLALGIGVNATVFSVANAILFQRPQAADAGDLVRVYVNHHSPFRWTDYRLLKEEADVFSHVIAEVVQVVSVAAPQDVGGFAESEQARAALVSGDYFAALGLTPAAGRFPRIEREDTPSAVPQVVLSHAYWSSRFASDQGIVGKSVRINDRAFTVSGVAPPGFTTAQVLWAPDMYISASETPVLLGAGPEVLSGSLYLTARLAEGVSPTQANARVAQLFSVAAAGDSARLARQSWRVDDAVGLSAEMRGPVTAASGFLLAIAALVLLVACFNVGNLILARNAARTRELAVRVSLGASRWRIVRQLLAELGLIAVLGAALALAATQWTATFVAGFIPAEAGVRLETGMDPAIILFTLALVTIVLAVAGLAPAMRATRGDLTADLRDGTAGGGSRRTRLRRLFLGMQVSMSTVLVACAALFLQSLGNADPIDAGFDTSGILDARLELGQRNDAAATVELIDRLLARVRDLPGVEAATAASVAPLTASNSGSSVFLPGETDGRGTATYFVRVAPGYFGDMRMPLTTGREFAATDRDGSQPVVIVNETFAERLWPGESAVGKQLRFDSPTGPLREVVGVSRPIRYNSLGETPPIFLYLPYAQSSPRDMTLHVRVQPGASVPAISRAIMTAVRRLDPAIPPPRVRPLAEEQRVMLLPAQLGAAFTGLFGALALLLASVGIFGVAAFDLSQRMRELGIRSALGAPAAAILRTVLGDTMRTVLAGGLLGIGLALGVARLLAGQLHGVGTADPLTFIGTPLLLLAVAILATWGPARRATRIDPAEALRGDG